MIEVMHCSLTYFSSNPIFALFALAVVRLFIFVANFTGRQKRSVMYDMRVSSIYAFLYSDVYFSTFKNDVFEI